MYWADLRKLALLCTCVCHNHGHRCSCSWILFLQDLLMKATTSPNRQWQHENIGVLGSSCKGKFLSVLRYSSASFVSCCVVSKALDRRAICCLGQNWKRKDGCSVSKMHRLLIYFCAFHNIGYSHAGLRGDIRLQLQSLGYQYLSSNCSAPW